MDKLEWRTLVLLVRYGDDEFTVGFPETSASQTRRGAKRLWKVVEARSIQAIYEKGLSKNVKVTISIGSRISR